MAYDIAELAPRVRVATLIDERAEYQHEAIALFASLRRLGGRLSVASCVAYTLDEPPIAVREELERLSVEIRRAERVEPRCPNANKIVTLNHVDDFEWLVALDSDIVFAGDIADVVLRAESVRAKPVDRDRRLSLKQWERLFAHFRVDMPSSRNLTSFHLDETIGTYVNAGLLVVPRRYVRQLRSAWADYLTAILDAGYRLPTGDFRSSNQFGLAIALPAERIPVSPLPITLNFPTHRQNHPLAAPRELKPLVVHHHHRWSDDRTQLLPCGHAGADGAIETVNAVIRRPLERLTDAATPAGSLSRDAL